MLDQPLIINLAPTGAVSDARKNANVPITVDRIVADVAAAADAGASIAHLHVRNAEGKPSSDPGLFADLFSALRAHPKCSDLVLCATTSGRHGQTAEERAAVLRLPSDVRPDMGSLTLGSLNFPTSVSGNLPDTIRYLADAMGDLGIKPELEIFDAGMVEFAKLLIREGRIQPPYYFNIILGNIGGLQSTLPHIGFLMSILPEDSIVSVGGIGRQQRGANAIGLAAANGVRVGLEDNLWVDQTARTPASNKDLVRTLAAASHALGRRVSSAQETRALLGIDK